jgi:hypothetical protein
MTAIGLAGLPEGFTIGADGRMSRDDETKPIATGTSIRETEEAQKIFPIIDGEKVLLYAISGFVTLDDLNVLEDVNRKMTWLSKRTFTTCKKYLAAVVEKVTEEINEAKHANRIKTFPVSRRAENGTAYKLIDLVVAGYYAGVPSLGIAQITHTSGNEAEWEVNFYDSNYSFLLGSDPVRRAMYPDAGGIPDPRFAPYRKYPIQTLKDAEEYIKGYIAACSSEIGREVDPEHWRITGGRLHMARITPKGGFEWLTPPKSAAPLPPPVT